MSQAARSIEELFPLIEYCRAGNLRAVSEWIAEKKPLDLPAGKKTRRSSPLQIAIEKGFLTLAEMLLDGGSDPCANGSNALWDAVNNRRSDIAELLLDRGVLLDAVSFSSVCYSANPALIKLFLQRGANPTEGHPFYHGFRHCLQPMLGVYKAHVEKVPGLQIQADMALCHYAKEGNLRAVSLLMWAGARPDQIIPEEDCSEEFAGSFALLEAYRAGHIPILKRMKVENFPDKLPDLFNSFTLDDSTTALEYLLKLHPSLGDLPDGGTRIFDRAFWSLGWASNPKPIFGTRSSSKIDQCIDRIEFLAKHGAKWKPEINSLRYTRRHIRHLEPDKTLKLFGILYEHKAAEVDLMESLVGTPTMRAHLGDYTRKIAHLFHPPPAKKTRVTAITSPEEPKQPSVQATLPELAARAETFLIDLIKKSPGISFWDHRILTFTDNQKDRRALGMSKADERSRLDIFQKAAEKISRKFGTFEVEADGKSYSGSVRTITVLLKAGHEWSEVFDELFRGNPDLNPRRLTAPAMKLLSFFREQHSSDVWLGETALAEKAGLQTGSRTVNIYLEELRKKVGSIFHFNSREKSEGIPQDIEYRAWWDERLKSGSSSDIPVPISLNSIFPGPLGRLSKRDVDDWRTEIFDYILGSKPTGTEPLYILWIDTQKEMRRLFPNCNTAITSHGRGIAELVSELRLPEALKVGHDFRDSLHWFARIVPETDWAESLRIVEELCSQPSLKERYGLSEDAGRLLEWIEGLFEEEFLGDWTSIVEDAIERKIGIKCPWEQENMPAYLQFLLDEINRKTIYDLSVQPWKSYSRWQTRIRVQEKQSEEAKLVQNIQLLGLQRGKMLSEAEVHDFLSRLLDS